LASIALLARPSGRRKTIFICGNMLSICDKGPPQRKFSFIVALLPNICIIMLPLAIITLMASTHPALKAFVSEQVDPPPVFCGACGGGDGGGGKGTGGAMGGGIGGVTTTVVVVKDALSTPSAVARAAGESAAVCASVAAVAAVEPELPSVIVTT